jgi:dihydroorotate dehydrogenase
MIYRAIRSALFQLDPERAHQLAIRTLQLWGRLPQARPDATPVSLLGLQFPNRIGMAAGFDKDGVSLNGLGRLGFGFVEVGTITPRPQSGQARPRLFRVPSHQALVNRLGFPSEGAQVVAKRLQARRYGGIVGVNIGKNADTPIERAMDDYLSCLRSLHAVADYFAVNISSPNTAALRQLHEPARLEPLLTALLAERDTVIRGHSRTLPLLLKISPDLDDDSLFSLIKVARTAGLDGIIATNTTIQRSDSTLQAAPQPGGVSGPPVHAAALRTISLLRRELGPAYPLIGVGGINSAESALAMRQAGADLIQFYTGFIYKGPSLVQQCVAALQAPSSRS